MRHLFLFSICLAGIFFCLFGLSTCKPPVVYPAAFAVADSLASANPDSAVTLLAEWYKDMQTAPEPIRNYYQLLCIKANDKAYIQHTSDTLIKKLVRYYEGDGDKRRLPEAYYYAGRVLRDMNEDPQAIEYFQKALDVASDDKDLKLKGAICSQMGTLFYKQELYEQALILTRQACLYDIQSGDNEGLSYEYYTMGDIYWDRFQLDSAEFYFKASISLMETLKDTLDINMMKVQLGHLYIDLHRYDEVEKLIRPYINHHYDFDKKYIYPITGKYFLAIQQFDSARIYYEKAAACNNIYAKRTAYWGLSQIALAHNKKEEGQHYLACYKLYEDSIQELKKAQEVGLNYFKYQYEQYEKENKRLKEAYAQKIKYLTIGLTLVVIILTGGIAYIIYNRRKRKPADSTSLKSTSTFDPEISPYTLKEDSTLIPDIEKAITTSITSMPELSLDILDGPNKNGTDNQQNVSAPAVREPFEIMPLTELRIYLLGKAYKGELLREKDWATVENVIRKNFPEFIDKLRKTYPCSTVEIRTCMLIKLKVSPVNIAIFIGQSKEGVSSIRRRLHQKVFGGKGSAPKWDAFIDTL